MCVQFQEHHFYRVNLAICLHVRLLCGSSVVQKTTIVTHAECERQEIRKFADCLRKQLSIAFGGHVRKC